MSLEQLAARYHPEGEGPKKNEEQAPQTAQERAEFYLKLNDPRLTELVQSWLNIRMAQGSPDSVRVPDDTVRLDFLYEGINKRLGELGRPPLASPEDLP